MLPSQQQPWYCKWKIDIDPWYPWGGISTSYSVCGEMVFANAVHLYFPKETWNGQTAMLSTSWLTGMLYSWTAEVLRSTTASPGDGWLVLAPPSSTKRSPITLAVWEYLRRQRIYKIWNDMKGFRTLLYLMRLNLVEHWVTLWQQT